MDQEPDLSSSNFQDQNSSRFGEKKLRKKSPDEVSGRIGMIQTHDMAEFDFLGGPSTYSATNKSTKGKKRMNSRDGTSTFSNNSVDISSLRNRRKRGTKGNSEYSIANTSSKVEPRSFFSGNGSGFGSINGSQDVDMESEKVLLPKINMRGANYDEGVDPDQDYSLHRNEKLRQLAGLNSNSEFYRHIAVLHSSQREEAYKKRLDHYQSKVENKDAKVLVLETQLKSLDEKQEALKHEFKSMRVKAESESKTYKGKLRKIETELSKHRGVIQESEKTLTEKSSRLTEYQECLQTLADKVSKAKFVSPRRLQDAIKTISDNPRPSLLERMNLEDGSDIDETSSGNSKSSRSGSTRNGYRPASRDPAAGLTDISEIKRNPGEEWSIDSNYKRVDLDNLNSSQLPKINGASTTTNANTTEMSLLRDLKTPAGTSAETERSSSKSKKNPKNRKNKAPSSSSSSSKTTNKDPTSPDNHKHLQGKDLPSPSRRRTPRHSKPSSISSSLNTTSDPNPNTTTTKSPRREKRPPYVFSSGSTYTGEWLGDKRDGYGVQTFPDKARYEGDWKNNQAHGKGKFYHSNGDIYEGDWKHAKANGFGVYMASKGVKYQGEFTDDLQHGKGLETWPDGSWYEGSYKDGKKEGFGKYFFKETEAHYDGNWRNGNIDGFGKYVWKDGRTYEGEWVANKIEGKGKYTYPDGREYDGAYKAEKKHGYGVYKWPDGRRYEGDWIDGKQHGRGKVILPDGETREGKWKKGKMVG